jgi:hypothetical protein
MGGRYYAFDAGSPLATQGGKADVARTLLAGGALPRPALGVGDGSTDVALRGGAGSAGCDAFAAFTGFARRAAVIAAADHEVASFDALAALVLDGAGGTGA